MARKIVGTRVKINNKNAVSHLRTGVIDKIDKGHYEGSGYAPFVLNTTTLVPVGGHGTNWSRLEGNTMSKKIVAHVVHGSIVEIVLEGDLFNGRLYWVTEGV